MTEQNPEYSLTDCLADEAHWTKNENERVESEISSLPGRAYVAERLQQLYLFEEPSDLQIRAAQLFFIRRSITTQRASLWCCDGKGSAERMLLGDAAQPFSKYVVLGECHASDDAELIALCLRSPIGGTRRTIRVLSVQSGALHVDVVQAGGPTVAWAPDGTGFYYICDPNYVDSLLNFPVLTKAAVCFHRLGSSQHCDNIVFTKQDDYQYAVDRRENGRFLTIRFSRYGVHNCCGLALKNLNDPNDVAREFIRESLSDWTIVGEIGPRVYALTTNGASQGRIVSIDVEEPNRRLVRTIPAGAPTEPMTCAVMLRDWVLVTYAVKGFTVLRRFHSNGEPAGDISLPSCGNVLELVAGERTNEAILLFTSYGVPPTLLCINASLGSVDVRVPPLRNLNLPVIAVEHVPRSKASGGIVLLRSNETKGPAPTLMCMRMACDDPSPAYDAPMALWLAQGGQIALVSPRVDFERQKSWKRMLPRTRRRRIKAAFVAAAEFMRRGSLASSVAVQCDPGHWSVLAEMAYSGGARLDAVLLGQGIGELSASYTRRTASSIDARKRRPAAVEEDDLYAIEPDSADKAERLNIHPPTLLTTSSFGPIAPAQAFTYINALRSEGGPVRPKLFQCDGGQPTNPLETIQRQANIFSFAAWWSELPLPT
ncbi:hypothetical protein [Pseudorhodoferax soli]|uniref:Prolyl oligopeptidase n=1 Tax=Pseudorhodoferax soli TaxID=545864 RepID=A0A368XJG4_9BURK|nr:hypothetical protein [Pseudorhodoferax soli]RCW68093.1 prolyl oligopeptidase [Pseudorhodoferax soli]